MAPKIKVVPIGTPIDINVPFDKIKTRIDWSEEFEALYRQYVQPLIDKKVQPNCIFGEYGEEFIWLDRNGSFHRDGDDLPAYIAPWSIEWYNHGRPHRVNNYSMIFPEGMRRWQLNGITVPEDVITTPVDKFKPELFTRETNVEIRREVIKKFGLTRVISVLNAKKVHSADITEEMTGRVHKYDLLSIDLGERVGVWPILQMTNPSTGETHMEWVARECTTVESALNFRNGTTKPPVIIF